MRLTQFLTTDLTKKEKKEIIAESKRVGDILKERSDKLHELEQKKWEKGTVNPSPKVEIEIPKFESAHPSGIKRVF
ncbi:MAG: hypothetical protein MZV64_27225 [Ignavibacteriales bacterium]|nr:hypothetical protein [Ignavibacteriales bacterium]